MINNNSEYQVGKVENGVYKTIKTLSYSEYISLTAGEYNEIKILCDERKIKCYVLGYEIYSFDLEDNVIIKNSKVPYFFISMSPLFFTNFVRFYIFKPLYIK